MITDRPDKGEDFLWFDWEFASFTPDALGCLIHNLYQSLISGYPIKIRLGKGTRGKPPRHYKGTYISIDKIGQARKELKERGWIQETIGNKFNKTCTLLEPTELFKEWAATQTFDRIRLQEKGYILLRSKEKGDKGTLLHFDYRSETPAKLQRNLDLINGVQSKINVSLNGKQLGEEYLIYNRSFNGDFSTGGRFYAPFQNMKKDDRLELKIDGKAICELDFSQLHPTILYHLSSINPYLGVYENIHTIRKVGKAAMVRAMNTSAKGAKKSLCKEFPELTWNEVNVIVERIKQLHKPIEHFLFKTEGVWGRLHNIDSRIAERVLLTFSEKGLPCLCVHDSFITTRDQEELLKETMLSSYLEVLALEVPSNFVSQITPPRIDPKTSSPLTGVSLNAKSLFPGRSLTAWGA